MVTGNSAYVLITLSLKRAYAIKFDTWIVGLNDHTQQIPLFFSCSLLNSSHDFTFLSLFSPSVVADKLPHYIFYNSSFHTIFYPLSTFPVSILLLLSVIVDTVWKYQITPSVSQSSLPSWYQFFFLFFLCSCFSKASTNTSLVFSPFLVTFSAEF